MPQPLRLALVTTELRYGGAEQCLVRLATRLSSDDFAPQVYSLAPPPAEHRAGLVEQLQAAEVPIHFLGLRSKWRIWSAVRALAGKLSEQQPHVLQSFLFHANITSALAARRAKVNRLIAGIRVADPARRRLWLEARLAGRIDRFVCVSDAVRQFAVTNGGLPADRTLVIPNGIDMQEVSATPAVDLESLGLPPGKQALVCIGRLEPQKGLDWLIGFARQFLDPLPDHDVLLIGEGSEEESLRKTAAAAGLSDRVHFCGWRPSSVGILKSASLLLAPSRWEGMPNVVLEAMAAGTPLVATSVEGVAELLGPGTSQQAVAFGDESDFVAHVLRAVNEPEKARQLAEQNRRRVAEIFSLEAMVTAYAKLYCELPNSA